MNTTDAVHLLTRLGIDNPVAILNQAFKDDKYVIPGQNITVICLIPDAADPQFTTRQRTKAEWRQP